MNIATIIKRLGLISGVFIFGLAASYGCQRANDRFTVNMNGYTERCIDGVSYVVFSTGASVKYKADGSLVTC